MTVYGNTILTLADIANEYPKGVLRDMTYMLAARSPLRRANTRANGSATRCTPRARSAA